MCRLLSQAHLPKTDFQSDVSQGLDNIQPLQLRRPLFASWHNGFIEWPGFYPKHSYLEQADFDTVAVDSFNAGLSVEVRALKRAKGSKAKCREKYRSKQTDSVSKLKSSSR